MSQRELRLGPGEVVLLDLVASYFWTALTYVATLGLWAIWRSRHRFILTNQRVVRTQGVISRFEQSVPLVRVQNVAFTWHWAIGGYVRLSSAGGPLGFERLGPFSRPAARQLADAVTELIRSNYGDGVSSGFTPVGLSAAGELERLSALQQAGVLTEEEFQAEKAKILSR